MYHRHVYLLIALSILLLGFIAQRFGTNWQALAASALVIVLLVLATIDLRRRILPDNLTQPLLWLGLLVNIKATFISLQDAVIGAIVGYGLLWLVATLYLRWRHQHGLGRGDFKLMAALGAWLGWQALPGVLILASVSGTLTALLLAWQRRQAPLKIAIPFGPFLAAAGILSLFFPHWLTENWL